MTMMKTLKMTAMAVGLGAAPAMAADVEVLHWWTSGGEAAALNVLKEDLAGQGIGWQDMPVAGGGGTQAMTVLRARVTSGNAPTAVQMLGFDITDWAKEGALANLNPIAEEGNWDEVIPAALQKFATHDGQWVSAPVNVHSTNWVWANKAIMDELGLEEPQSWDDFVAALEAAEAAGELLVHRAHELGERGRRVLLDQERHLVEVDRLRVPRLRHVLEHEAHLAVELRDGVQHGGLLRRR